MHEKRVFGEKIQSIDETITLSAVKQGVESIMH